MREIFALGKRGKNWVAKEGGSSEWLAAKIKLKNSESL